MDMVKPDAVEVPTRCNVCSSENFTDDEFDRDWSCGRQWNFLDNRWSNTCGNDPTAKTEPPASPWASSFSRLGGMWLAILAGFLLYAVMRWEGSTAAHAAMWSLAFGFLIKFWADD